MTQTMEQFNAIFQKYSGNLVYSEIIAYDEMITIIKHELQEFITNIIISDNKNMLDAPIPYKIINLFVETINDNMEQIIKLFLERFLFRDLIPDFRKIQNYLIYLYDYLHPIDPFNYKIDWSELSPNLSFLDRYILYNTDNIIHQYKDNIDEYFHELKLRFNIFEIDYNPLVNYNQIKERCGIFKEELIQVALHPNRIQKYFDQGYDIEDLEKII